MIQDVIRDTLSVLERQGYKVHNTRKYNTIYHGLAKYCWNNYDGEYTQEIGDSFVQSLRERNPPLSKSFLNTYITAVERANHVIEGEENWYPRKKLFDYDDSAFRNEAAMYNEYLLNSGKTKNDVRGRICLHCMRHTFAVNSFRKQDHAGVDMYTATPFLSTYMGHDNILGTQTYLHMTAENSVDVIEQTTEYTVGLFPEVPR
jgi:hypothetical protein